MGAPWPPTPEEMLATWQDGDVRDIHQEMMQLTMRIVAKVLFSVEVKADTERVAGALNILMRHTSGGRMILPPVLRHVPVPAMMRVKRAVRELDEIVNRIIRQRRASGEDTGDLLSMLMAARDEDGSGMTDRQLRDEILTFLLAGHETTAVSLSWTWYLLSQHPEVEQKLHQELSQVLGGRTPQLEDLPRLPYTDKVVKESMRLYPPAWSLARTVAKEVELGGYRLPVGANVVMSPWILHRDPRFFNQPEQFNPERWTGGGGPTSPALRLLPLWRRTAPVHRRLVRHDGGEPASGGDCTALSVAAGPWTSRSRAAQHYAAPQAWHAHVAIQKRLTRS